VLETVGILNDERRQDIIDIRHSMDEIRDDLKEIRRQEFEHVNTPKAAHAKHD